MFLDMIDNEDVVFLVGFDIKEYVFMFFLDGNIIKLNFICL